MLGQSVVAAFPLFLLPCLLSQSTHQGDSRLCYEVRNETVCYFRPPNGLEMNWDEANKFCRDRNATLPAILDSDHQRTIEMYLTQHPVGNSLVLTAGRKSWSLDANYPWRWVNGKQFRTSKMAVLVADAIFGCIQFDVAMIRDGISPCSFYPGSFICQYPESVCVTLDRTASHLHIGSHCFVQRNDHLRWYHARNKCIEGGGDLATFDDVDSLTAFRNFTSVATSIFGPTSYFVGLQKKWWTWRAMESLDVTYTNWPQRRDHELYTPDDQDGLDCLCSDVLNDYKWRSCNCLKEKSIICQSGSRIDRFSNASRCYDVGRTDQVCYFTQETASRLNFAGASQWCRDHNATLPIIRNKVYQKSLESFLETTSLPVYHLWTSGIKVKTGIWSWINGQPFGESDMDDIKRPFSYHVRTRSTETLERKGRLWRTRSSEKNPNSQHAGYICQFPGDSCGRFVNGFRTKDDACLVAYDEKVSWYTSRNKCIDSGGDLATFEDPSKLETLSSLLATEESYHVGLEKSRWIWYRAGADNDNLLQFPSFDFHQRSPETLEQKGRLYRFSSYDKRLKDNNNNTGYICQLPGPSCPANAIRTKGNECQVVSEDQVSWYEARNRCILDRGDLATFEDVSNIDKFSPLLTFDKSYHIGLENSQWNWYQAVTDKFTETARYTNFNKSFSEFLNSEDRISCSLPSNHRFHEQCSLELENNFFCLCLETFTYKWTPCNCDLTLRFVCQRAETKNGSETTVQSEKLDCRAPFHQVSSSEDYGGMIIAVVEGLIIVILIVVVVSLVIYHRKRTEAVADNLALEMRAQSDNEYACINTRIDTAPSEYQELKLVSKIC